MQNPTSYLPIMQFTRGEIIESIHFGAAVVVRADGRIIATYGDPQALTYLRSSSKPFQVLGLIENGGIEKFGFTQEEVAVMCASHSGTPKHVEVVQSIHEKIGAKAEDMLCGMHYPFDKESANQMRIAGEQPSQYHHNCSGKHSGMLAYCKLMGWDEENYIDPAHPLQQDILNTFADIVRMDPNNIYIGIDGCSVPVFGIPMYNAAWGFARMASPALTDLKEKRAEACVTVREAMMAHPYMVAGPKRFDTDLMQAIPGRIFAKGGAEGYQGIGVLPYGNIDRGLGIAIKVSDGDLTDRVRPAVSLKVLQSLYALSDEELKSLSTYGPIIDVHNWVKTVVGKGTPSFELEFYE